MMNDDHFLSKADLLARIRDRRAQFAALWQELTPAQMTQRPGVQSDWSVKDLIAHIVAWEEWIIDKIAALRQDHIVPVPDIDAFNALVFEQNKDRALPDVLETFEMSRDKLIATLDTLSEAEINAPSPIAGLDPIRDDIIASTIGHYADHQPDLQRYCTQVQGTH